MSTSRVLTNSDAPPRRPEDSAVKTAAEVIGAPVQDPSAIAVPVDVLDTYVGRDQIAAGDARTIERDGTRMFSQRNGGEASELISIGAGSFPSEIRFSGSRSKGMCPAASFESSRERSVARRKLVSDFDSNRKCWPV